MAAPSSPPAGAAPRRLPSPPYLKRGTWNSVETWMGPPGSGKSQAMMRAALEWVPKSYLLAHDPNENLPTVLHDGTRVPIVRHRDLASVRQALATQPRGIHAVSSDPGELIELGKGLARVGMVRRGADEWGVPVIVMLDEIVAWREAGRSRIGPQLEDLLARRRPYHVAFWYGAQYPRMVHYSLISQATALHLGPIVDKKDLDRLTDGGVPTEVIARVIAQGKHDFLTYRR